MDIINTNDKFIAYSNADSNADSNVDSNVDNTANNNSDSNEIVKQPAKKRGRKPKISNTEINNTEISNTKIKEKKKKRIIKDKKHGLTDISDVSLVTEDLVIDKGARGSEALVTEDLVVDDDIAMKTKRRGRKPKDKFKFESSEYDEFQKNSKKEDNIIIKLPLSCLKLNEEFNIGKELFPYNPNLSIPKPYTQEYLITKHNIGFSMLDNEETNSSSNDNDLERTIYKNIIETKCENVDDTIGCTIVENTYSTECLYEDNVSNNNVSNNNVSNNNLFNKKENYYDLNKQFMEKLELNKDNKKILQQIQFCNKCSHCQKNKNNEYDIRQIDIILNNKYNSNTDKFNVLTHLGINLNGGKWIEKTDVACLFCCHSFKETPWGIPYKFKDGVFYLFGNFCLPNCALAHILQTYKDDDSLWEKVALLNLLCFKVYGKYKNLQPSFDKMALIMFGGTLDIIDYRNIISTNEKTYSIEFPPCNTIIPMLEEIYKKSALSNTFIPIDKNRINVANNELKLKRSKPIINHKNTLDFCLGKV